MKNKIKRFAKGDFHIPQPDIIFPETHIVMRVGEGEEYKGSFSLQNQGEGTIRGLVYPSSYRVRCAEQGFDGNPVNISYTYDGRGLVPGHVEHGKFTIVCNGGEYDIAFTAIIEKPFVMTSYGKVQSASGNWTSTGWKNSLSAASRKRRSSSLLRKRAARSCL